MEARDVAFFSLSIGDHALVKIFYERNVIILDEMHVAAILEFQPLPSCLKYGSIALFLALMIARLEPR